MGSIRIPLKVTNVSAQLLHPKAGDALMIVDVQKDFLPGGALAVPSGQEVIAPLNRCSGEFERRRLPIFATRDWHPADHCSFRERGGPWPAHCVAGSTGAEFAAELSLPPDVRIISKATEAQAEAYSGFQGTNLAEQLAGLGCSRLFLGGVATDYCVRETALDARSGGFDVIVLEDAVRAVDVHAGDGERALRELVSKGVRLARTEDLLS